MYRRECGHCSGSSAIRSSGSPVIRLGLAVLCCLLGAICAAPSLADASKSGLGDVFVIDALVTPPVTTGEETSQAEINAVIAPLLGDSIRL